MGPDITRDGPGPLGALGPVAPTPSSGFTLGTPPFGPTEYITPNLITSADSSSFKSATYKGQDIREYWTGYSGNHVSAEVYLFDVAFTSGQGMEFQVHPEVGGMEVARQEVVKHATAIGRLPVILLGFIEVEIGRNNDTARSGVMGVVYINVLHANIQQIRGF